MEHTFELRKGEVVRMHIGTFFGIYDLNIRTISAGKIIPVFDEEPVDLIDNPDTNAPPVPKVDKTGDEVGNCPTCDAISASWDNEYDSHWGKKKDDKTGDKGGFMMEHKITKDDIHTMIEHGKLRLVNGDWLIYYYSCDEETPTGSSLAHPENVSGDGDGDKEVSERH